MLSNFVTQRDIFCIRVFLVSSSDILVLATRDAVGLAGGPLYPLLTGRRESSLSFPEVASFELPDPQDDLTKTLLSFSSRGFDERETVSLLGGGHSIGVIHCRFFRNRLYNYAGSGTADPSLEEGFLHLMRTTCNWVRAYASHATLFRRDFSMVMMKLSALEMIQDVTEMLLARLMSTVLAKNPSIVGRKRVLELGCGCTGICSMVAARYADLVVATDGDLKSLELLNQNVISNLEQPIISKMFTKRLEWGNSDHVESVKELSPIGFEVIIGTDVMYVAQVISPFFATAVELISYNEGVNGGAKPALIFCHIVRRVDENLILPAASQFSFRLVDRWPGGMITDQSRIISSWCSELVTM